MSGMEFNKIFAAVLTAGVIAMMASFISRQLVHPEDPYETAIVIDGVAAEIDAGPTGPEPILAMIGGADIAAGENLARACTACHTFVEGGANRVGPNLWAIVNADKAHLDDYAYSTALAEDEGVWNYQSLNHFLWKPRDYLSGTKMSYAGMRDPEDRANLIAWMRTLDSEPAPLPTEEEIAAEAGVGEAAAEAGAAEGTATDGDAAMADEAQADEESAATDEAPAVGEEAAGDGQTAELPETDTENGDAGDEEAATGETDGSSDAEAEPASEDL